MAKLAKINIKWGILLVVNIWLRPMLSTLYEEKLLSIVYRNLLS